LVPEKSSAARHRLRLFLTIASSTNAEQNCSQLKDPGTFHFSFAIAEAYSAAARTPTFPDSLFSSFHKQNVLTVYLTVKFILVEKLSIFGSGASAK